MLIRFCFCYFEAALTDQPDWLESLPAFLSCVVFYKSLYSTEIWGAGKESVEIKLFQKSMHQGTSRSCFPAFADLCSHLFIFTWRAHFYLLLHLIELNLCAALLFHFLPSSHITFMCLFVGTRFFKTWVSWQTLRNWAILKTNLKLLSKTCRDALDFLLTQIFPIGF